VCATARSFAWTARALPLVRKAEGAADRVSRCCSAREASARARPHLLGSSRCAGRWRGQPSSEGGRDGIRFTRGLRWPAPVAGDPTRVPPRPTASRQGLRYPPDPPTVEEIIAVMSAAGDEPDGVRLRGLIVVLWRAGLRISEALALAESDLDRVRGAIQLRHGKGGRRREVGMDRWAWERLDPWPARPDSRTAVLSGRDPCAAAQRRGHSRGASAVGAASAPACTRGRDVAPRRTAGGHPAATCQPRDHVGVPARNRHTEIVNAVHERPAPMISATNGLRLAR